MTVQTEGKQFQKQIDSDCATVCRTVAIEMTWNNRNKNKRRRRWERKIEANEANELIRLIS